MENAIVLQYHVSADDFTRAGEASSDVKGKLKQLGISPEAVRKVAIAMYEGEINMVIHAKGGEITVESVVCDGKDGALYDLSALEQKDKYELFLGGNYGQCVITTGTENGKHLLLVKDSFANSFVPFLTGDYETITMIDLRYYRGSMAELAAEVDDILVLTEVTNLAGSGDYFKLSK